MLDKWWNSSFFFEMTESQWISLPVPFFVSKSGHVLFPRHVLISMVQNVWNSLRIRWEMGHFNDTKSGAFRGKITWLILKRERTENEYVRFSGISKKNANATTRQNSYSHGFWGISGYLMSLKSFSGGTLIYINMSLSQITGNRG